MYSMIYNKEEYVFQDTQGIGCIPGYTPRKTMYSRIHNKEDDIYIKKDVHPAVRKEWARLREAERLEKEKPENNGATIRLDTRERKLYRDDTVIDSWTPHPF